jgi:hypothetical protein
MKHILILLISILLFSSPLFGQSKETGVLYQYKTSSGFVWKTFGKGEVQPKYKGEISNGTPEGLGVLSYPFTDGKRVVGEWKDGKEWNTEHYKKDGKVIGKWVSGKWILKWGVLCGTLEEGAMVWFEKCYDGVESKYVGDIENMKPNGQGILTSLDGYKYVGEFYDGKQHGQGTITFSDGNKGVGEFRGNKSWNITTYDKDGNIIWMMLNGVKVEKKILFRDTPRSKWVKGGEKWFRSGDEKRQAKYEGEIVTGVPNGWGTITFPSGSNYVGGFKDGKRTGQGTMSFFDGGKYKGKYEGKWNDGRKNGQGTETYPSGRKYEGEWKNNKPWEGTLYDKNENIIGRVVNGEQQK